MHRITVNKKEDIASLVERLIEEKGDKITLVIPRDSQIGEVEANFKLLAREAEGVGKELSIESIDEKVLGYAHKHGLNAEHPLFHKNQASSLTDIITGSEKESHHAASSKKVKAHHVAVAIDHGHEEIETEEAEDSEDEEAEADVEDVEEEVREEVYASDLSSSWMRKLSWAGVAVAGVLLVFGLFGWFFGKVTVSLAFIKTPFEETFDIAAEKSREVADAEKEIIPAVLFTEEKNIVQTFKASGRERVARKAKAKVTIYNAFNSKPQVLVATTRFQTPDGKIFRLDQQITVPGANVEDGKIVPAGIEASVTADQAGEAYNIGPIAKMSIPGFKGSERYDGFYAVLGGKADGGMVGEAPVPTEADIKEAETKTREAVLAAVSGSLSRRLPAEYTLLEEASEVGVTKLTVNTEADESGNFTVFGEARQSVLVFREKDILYLLGEKTDALSANKELQDVKLKYENIKANFNSGTLAFKITAQGVLVSPFSSSDFKSKLAGASLDNLKRELASVTGVSEAKFFVYPPWIWNVPSNPDRIEVKVD